MEKLSNLRALCNFLGKAPYSKQLYNYFGLQCNFFYPKCNRLYALLELYDRPRPADTVKKNISTPEDSEFPEIDELLNKNREYTSFGGGKYYTLLGDSLLFALTRIASGDSRKAGYACYILGSLYDNLRSSAYPTHDIASNYRCAAYFYGKALEKDYVTDASKKAYAEACAHLGWFDTALYWYPKCNGENQLAHTYLSHRIRFCKEHGVTFPKTQNHIVCFEESGKAKELESMLNRFYGSEDDIILKLEELESKVSGKVTELKELLDYEEYKLLNKRKWSRRKWWLVYLLLVICAAPGFLHGNGEGLQGLSYKLFISTFSPFGNAFTEGMTFIQRLSSNLDDSACATIAGTGIATYAILTLLWTTFLKFFVKKKHAKVYGKLKRKLYDECQFEEIMREIEYIKISDNSAVPDGYETLNKFAQAWHNEVVANAPKVNIPSVYGESVKSMSFAAGEELLNDYDAFVNALRMVPEKSEEHVLLWSGDELAFIYPDLKGLNESQFVEYFTQMFESSAMLAKSRGHNDSHDKKQIDILQVTVANIDLDRIYAEMVAATPADPPKSEPVESIGKMLADEFNRAANLFAHGVSATNDEIIDALERQGKISSTLADKARFSPRGLEELKNKDKDKEY